MRVVVVFHLIDADQLRACELEDVSDGRKPQPKDCFNFDGARYQVVETDEVFGAVGSTPGKNATDENASAKGVVVLGFAKSCGAGTGQLMDLLSGRGFAEDKVIALLLGLRYQGSRERGAKISPMLEVNTAAIDEADKIVLVGARRIAGCDAGRSLLH